MAERRTAPHTATTGEAEERREHLLVGNVPKRGGAWQGGIFREAMEKLAMWQQPHRNVSKGAALFHLNAKICWSWT